MDRKKTKTMTECAIMITLSLILNLIPIIKLPNGGSVTAGSLSPIIIFSINNRVRWGLLCSFIYSLINMIISFHVPPTKSLSGFTMVIIFDYFLSSLPIGISRIFYNRTKYFSIFIIMAIRYICFVISGVLIWKDYVPSGIPVLTYSIIYNAMYMLPETIITYILSKVMIKSIEKFKNLNKGE